MTSKSGKTLEKKVKENKPDLLRLYDTTTAFSGFIPAQPADFVKPEYFVECKDTEKGYFEKKNFKPKQLALQKFWLIKHNVMTYYILRFTDNNIITVPLPVITSFMGNKGKGKLFYKDVADKGVELC